MVTDLPAHVDAFVADRVARSHAADSSDGRWPRRSAVPVEQMLSVVLPGFEPTGRRHHRQPFADVVPGFFDYLVEERGLRPGVVASLSPSPERFEAYSAGSAWIGAGELSPAVLSASSSNAPPSGLAKSTVRDTAGVLRVFLRYAHREACLATDLSDAVGWPQVYRLVEHPPVDLLGRRQPGAGRR